MEPLDVVSVAVGVVLVGLVLWDAFQTIVVPRPTPGVFRIGRHLIRAAWPVWRDVTIRYRQELARDRLLGMFAPAFVVTLLASWLVVVVLGYGLIYFGLRNQLEPVPQDLAHTAYLAGTSVFTLGAADVLVAGPAARLVTLVAAATGLGIVALVITFLFSLFASFQRREILVVTLQARAGAPPSAVALLEAHRGLGLVDDLPALFEAWEVWSAEVLDSHVAFPLLTWFRSSHDNLSWIGALAAVLDASTLVLTTVRGVPHGHAELMKRVGSHLIEDLTNLMNIGTEGGTVVERHEFDLAYNRLAAAGYDLEDLDEAWHGFERARQPYAARLEALASYLSMPATRWIGELVPLDSRVHQGPRASRRVRG
jgi:hypothetical protein